MQFLTPFCLQAKGQSQVKQIKKNFKVEAQTQARRGQGVNGSKGRIINRSFCFEMLFIHHMCFELIISVFLY